MRLSYLLAGALTIAATRASAQDAVMVYTLGRDTVAVEQFTRTPSRFSGEMVSRSGAAVIRTQYDFTIGSDGRPTAFTLRRRQPNGAPLATGPTEVRYAFRADSTKVEIVWPDSTQSRMFAAARAFPSLPVYMYAPFELIYGLGRSGGSRDSIPFVPTGGTNIGLGGLRPYSGDTLQLRGGVYPMLVRFDREGRLQTVDGSLTTNKMTGTRRPGRVDIAAIAAAMRPTGTLSPRATAYAAFAQGPIFVNYSRPAVRERTVWGGTLVPYDSVWRTGANEATHLATSKTIAFGDLTLTPGLYTLWIQHTRTGTFLIVNRQVGQWGTAYQASQDIGRVAMQFADAPEHVEDFTITVRSLGGGRGAIDFAWARSIATANFVVRP